ncbi:MAG: type II secretion system F family protein [Sandarakinorhabdus sp.]|nr:type II secretion system F family protein [Sandarakinorhabdus sp.]
MSGEISTYLILGLVFAAVVMSVLAVAPMFGRKVDLAARLSTTPTGSATAAGGQTLRADQGGSSWARLVAEVERRGLSLEDSKGAVLADQLMLAGYSQPHAARAFVLVKMSLTLALPAIAYAIISVTGTVLAPTTLYITLGGAAAFGLYYPNVRIKSKAEDRKKEILNGFPDALDLMLVCVEAGLGIDACFARVGQEIIDLHPRLSELFATVSLELRAGRPRAEALKNMARRSGVPEIASFCTLVIQSDRLGASIGQALKVYALEMREGRRMRAEEKAAKLPVLLSIPLVMFLLPSMIGVLMLPAVISMQSMDFGG